VTAQAITTLSNQVGVRAACAALGVARAGYYRRHRVSPIPPGGRRWPTGTAHSRDRLGAVGVAMAAAVRPISGTWLPFPGPANRVPGLRDPRLRPPGEPCLGAAVAVLEVQLP